MWPNLSCCLLEECCSGQPQFGKHKIRYSLSMSGLWDCFVKCLKTKRMETGEQLLLLAVQQSVNPGVLYFCYWQRMKWTCIESCLLLGSERKYPAKLVCFDEGVSFDFWPGHLYSQPLSESSQLPEVTSCCWNPCSYHRFSSVLQRREELLILWRTRLHLMPMPIMFQTTRIQGDGGDFMGG